jgi:hypothetical protein
MLECQAFDPVSYVTTPSLEEVLVRLHLATCWECAEDVAECQRLRRPLLEEVTAAYRDVTLDATRGPDALPQVPGPSCSAGPAGPAARQALPLPLIEEAVSPEGTFARPLLHLGMRIVMSRERGRGGRQGKFVVVTTPERELFFPLGAVVQGTYTVHTDCYLCIVLHDAHGDMQLLWPTEAAPSALQEAGTAVLPLAVRGNHGERQRLDLVVTRTPLLPPRLPFADASRLAVRCHEALDYVRQRPQEEWAIVPLAFTVVDPQRVATTRDLPVHTLASDCAAELHDKGDAAKVACAEVCHRLLSFPPTAWGDPNVAQLYQLFRGITERLVWRVVSNLRDGEDQAVKRTIIDTVYSEFYASAEECSLRAQPESFGAKFLRTCHRQDGGFFTYFSYFALLEYLRKIALIHTFAEEKEHWDSLRKAHLPQLRQGLPRLAEDVRTDLTTWAYQYVLREEVSQDIFAGLLRGDRPPAMLQRSARLQHFLQDLSESDAKKKLHNLRDSTAWRVYKGVMRKGPERLQHALQHLLVASP